MSYSDFGYDNAGNVLGSTSGWSEQRHFWPRGEHITTTAYKTGIPPTAYPAPHILLPVEDAQVVDVQNEGLECFHACNNVIYGEKFGGLCPTNFCGARAACCRVPDENYDYAFPPTYAGGRIDERHYCQEVVDWEMHAYNGDVFRDRRATETFLPRRRAVAVPAAD